MPRILPQWLAAVKNSLMLERTMQNFPERIGKNLFPLKLKEGQSVELVIKKFPEAKRDPAYDLSDLAVETGIRDLASEHNHYLYGTPKRGKRNVRKTRIR